MPPVGRSWCLSDRDGIASRHPGSGSRLESSAENKITPASTGCRPPSRVAPVRNSRSSGSMEPRLCSLEDRLITRAGALSRSGLEQQSHQDERRY